MKQLRRRALEKSRTSRVSGKMSEEPYCKKAPAAVCLLPGFVHKNIMGTEEYVMLKEDWICRRGDLYLADMGPSSGSQQGGIRPVVVLQNDVGNYYAPTVTVAPLTSRMKKTRQPTHYTLRKAPGLKKESIVLAEQMMTLDKRNLIRYLGRVASKEMRGIDNAVRVQLGFYIPERAERRYRYKDGKMIRNETKHRQGGVRDARKNEVQLPGDGHSQDRPQPAG